MISKDNYYYNQRGPFHISDRLNKNFHLIKFYKDLIDYFHFLDKYHKYYYLLRFLNKMNLNYIILIQSVQKY